MNFKKIVMPTKRKVIFIGIVAIVIYINFFQGRVRFKEEIELDDHEIIVVDRLVKTNSFGEVGGPGGWEVKYNSLEVYQTQRTNLPAKWETEEEIMPVIFDFDRDKKEWFIVSVIVSCTAWEKLGKPEYPYAEDRFRNGKWERVNLSSELKGRPANVLYGIRSRGEEGWIHLLEKFQRMNEVGVVKRYISVTNKWRSC